MALFAAAAEKSRVVCAMCAMVVALASCTSASAEPESIATTVFIPQTVYVELTTPPPSTTLLPASDVDIDVAAEVESCVEQTMHYAFIGNEFWQQAWDDLGQDIDRLRGNCADLVITDPDVLREMHVNWLTVRATLADEPG